MIPQNAARIFLADRRLVSEKESYCRTTFVARKNGSSLSDSLLCCKDDLLLAGHSIRLTSAEDAGLLLLPVAGTICCEDDAGGEFFIEPGQAHFFSVRQGEGIGLQNGYETESINFLQLWFRMEEIPARGRETCEAFDFGADKNRLIHISGTGTGIEFFIGCFDGRAETLFRASSSGSTVFVFVIDGAFEVQFRLLEARDGLALWNANEVELEALSNNAVILFAEIPGRG